MSFNVEHNWNADSDVRSVNVKKTRMFSEKEQSRSASKLSETVVHLSERFLGFLNEGQSAKLPDSIMFHYNVPLLTQVHSQLHHSYLSCKRGSIHQ